MCKSQTQVFSRCHHLQVTIEYCAASQGSTERCFGPNESGEYDAEKYGYLRTDDYCKDCKGRVICEGVNRRDIGADERSDPSNLSRLAKMCGYEWVGESRIKDFRGLEQVIRRWRLWGREVTFEWYELGYFPQRIKLVSEAPADWPTLAEARTMKSHTNTAGQGVLRSLRG